MLRNLLPLRPATLLVLFPLWFVTVRAAVPAIKCFGPEARAGISIAVMLEDAPLVHTGQLLPLNRQGQLVGPGDAAKQTEQALSNVAAALNAGGARLANTVKLNICLAQAEAMPAVREVLSRRFTGPIKPAACFVVGKLAQPDALIAMDAVAPASLQNSPGKVSWFSAREVYDLGGIRHAAVLPAGPKIYVSGMADTNSLPLATRKTLEKLTSAIGHLGLGKTNVVQLKAFLEPMTNVAAVRKEIVGFFGGTAPPVVFVEWMSPSPNPPIEIELIAAAKGDFTKEAESVTFLTPPGTTSTKVYSRVARVNRGGLVYISGLHGIKSQDAPGQVREIFRLLGDVLRQTGSDFEHLAKATYYVTDNPASDALNNLRPEFYNTQRPPAASKAKVQGVGLPGKTVTMDMIAVTK